MQGGGNGPRFARMDASRASSGHRTPLGWLLLPYMLGLVVAKLSPVALPVLPLLGAAIAILGLSTAIARHRPRTWIATLALGLVLLGAGTYDWRRARQLDWDDWPVREAEITVKITRTFAGATGPDSLSGMAIVLHADRHLRALENQRIAVSLRLDPALPAPFRGVTLRVRGVLEPLPRRPPEDPFVEYLVDSGANFRLGRGRVLEVVHPGTGYARLREAARLRASAFLGRGLERHPELAGALRGMLLGERQGLSGEQEALYLESGTMHLFAISGLHISVIAGGVIVLLRALRLRPWPQFLLAAVILWGYVDLTGAVPSAVRAWLMVVCLHGAMVVRAPGNVASALAASALLVLLLDPMQLFGAGFQMSYGIVAALLLYGVPMAERWHQAVRPWVLVPAVALVWWQRTIIRACRCLQSSMAIGLAAALIGTISGVAFFGIFTPAAIVANLPLIPLASAAILAGFASLLSGMAGLTPLVVLFNHAGALVLLLMQQILEWIIRVPGASAPAEFRARWIGETAILLLLATMLWGYSTSWSRRSAGFWPPVLVTFLILLLGMRFVDPA